MDLEYNEVWMSEFPKEGPFLLDVNHAAGIAAADEAKHLSKHLWTRSRFWWPLWKDSMPREELLERLFHPEG